jgi:SPP1 gp7 family putative phage head morphogenesis protein
MARLSAYRLPPRAKRTPRPLQPDAVRMSYYTQIQAVVARAHALVKARLKPKLRELLAREREHHGDSLHFDAQPAGKRVNAILDGIANSLAREFDTARLERMARTAATATSDHQKREIRKQMVATVGVDPGFRDQNLRARINTFTAENVALIKSVPQKYLAEVRTTVLSGVRDGARASEIADDLEERFEVSESRALLIARDQIGKFNGELNEMRQTELGVSQYVWRTSEDQRVRDTHSELDGETFEWDDPPMGGGTSEDEEGNPGSGIQCRCWADPVLDDILNAE